MKKILIAMMCMCLGVFFLSAVGCGQESTSTTTAPDRPKMAYDFRDGAPNYYDEQKSCPVCGTESIKEDIYVDLQGKRVYFDKQECADKFEGDAQKYIQEWMNRIQEEQQEQAEQMRRQTDTDN